ncbi:MAG: hypothetical protein Q9219_004703 [cf. Caloplaca sp. 3 TL-2023]
MSIHTTRANPHFLLAFREYLSLPGPCRTARKPTFRFQPQHPHPPSSLIRFPRHASTTSRPPQRESLAPQTHYDLFPSSLPSGPPPTGSFHLDPSILRKEFLQLQARAHPDRHQGEQKSKAEAASARINDAYKTLLNPLARARYLLSLHGVELGEDESIAGAPEGMSDGGGAGGNVDAAFLMDVMEVREGIEEAGSREEVEVMKARNDERRRESEDRLDRMFREGDIEAARRETVKLGYWVNVGTALEGWEKVGDGRVSEHD